jgi:hypothetical protein
MTRDRVAAASQTAFQAERVSQNDLRVTFDSKEDTCGCYVSLYPTNNHMFFWADVITRHSSIIYSSLLMGQ